MQEEVIEREIAENRYSALFVEFIEAFAKIDRARGLFPKRCRVCDQEFTSYFKYIKHTVPKKHVFQDASDVMGRPWTMLYRHCLCGNTLILTLTEETFPLIDRFWERLRQEAEERGTTLETVIDEFRRQCDHYIESIA